MDNKDLAEANRIQAAIDNISVTTPKTIDFSGRIFLFNPNLENGVLKGTEVKLLADGHIVSPDASIGAAWRVDAARGLLFVSADGRILTFYDRPYVAKDGRLFLLGHRSDNRNHTLIEQLPDERQMVRQ